jgi:hypothetical protein
MLMLGRITNREREREKQITEFLMCVFTNVVFTLYYLLAYLAHISNNKQTEKKVL